MTKQSILRLFSSNKGWIAASPAVPRNDGREQSGNAVIFILIAIALFAALAYTFTRSAQTGQGNMTAGQVKLTAQEIVDYSSSVIAAVNKLRARGCSENELNFKNSVENTSTPGAPSDKSCNIFVSQGGPIPDVNKYIFSNPFVSGDSNINGLGTTAADLVYDMRISSNFSDSLITRSDICKKINDILGITSSTNPPTDSMNGGTKFNGTFVATPPGVSSKLIDVSAFVGKPAGCRLESGSIATGSAIFSFYFLLLER